MYNEGVALLPKEENKDIWLGRQTYLKWNFEERKWFKEDILGREKEKDAPFWHFPIPYKCEKQPGKEILFNIFRFLCVCVRERQKEEIWMEMAQLYSGYISEATYCKTENRSNI